MSVVLMLQVIYVSNNVYIQIKKKNLKKKKFMKYYQMVPSLRWRIFDHVMPLDNHGQVQMLDTF